VAAGSPSRNGDADASIRSYPNHVTSRSRMSDEIHERMNNSTPARILNRR
jgi:hypothetical protein